MASEGQIINKFTMELLEKWECCSTGQQSPTELWRLKGAIMQIAHVMINIIKHEMISKVTSHGITNVEKIVTDAFEVENLKEVYEHCSLLETLYYIGGWHLSACLKASEYFQRKNDDEKKNIKLLA